MYRCNECENIFHELGSYTEQRDGGSLEFDCCPFCEGTNYVELKEYVKDKIIDVLEDIGEETFDVAYDLFENKEI